eukprot:4841786-Pyramimonas_sp.AAC.1
MDPRAARSAHHLPRIVGHWHPRGQKGPAPVHGTSGPASTLRVQEAGVSEAHLIYDARGPPPGVRALLAQEVWQLRGRDQRGLGPGAHAVGPGGRPPGMIT